MNASVYNKNKRIPHSRKIFTFLGVFALILAISHFYMFERISYYLQLTAEQRIFTALLLGSLALFTLIVLPASRALPRVAVTILSWIIYPWMGIALLLFVLLLATDVVWLLLQLILTNHLPESRGLLQYCFGIVALIITGLLGIFALWKGLAPVTVRPVTVFLNRLPLSLDGLRIVQITDLHIGAMLNGNWLRRIVNKVNALQPDVIVITGDLVDGSVNDLRHHVAPLANLCASHGTFFITGNHEYYSGVEQWCDHITHLGIRVLRNERVSIPAVASENASIDLVGIDDWASHHFPGGGADLQKALVGRNSKKVLILLAHQPAAIEEAAAYNVDLQLSGHTHGGQLWPFKYLVYLQQPYAHGLYRHQGTDTQIYVSAGTGFWGPPMRLGATAEITNITLRVAH
jgi:predicted MPP superfamily phosphohydrolase